MFKRILFIYPTKRRKIFDDYLSGNAPSNLLYGLAELIKKGYKCDFVDAGYDQSKNPFYYIFYPLERFFQKIYDSSFHLYHVVYKLNAIKDYDLVIVTSEACALPLLLLKKIGIIKKPVIFLSITGIYSFEKIKNILLKKILKSLLTQANKIVCFCEDEVKKYKKSYGLKVYAVPFGIDSSFYLKNYDLKADKQHILFISKNRNKDMELISKLANLFPQEKFVIVTNNQPVKFCRPTNVEYKNNLDYREIMKLYSSAKLSLIPLKNPQINAGQTVFLENMMMVIPTVFQESVGLDQTYTLSRGLPFMIGVKSQGIDEWCRKIKIALSINSKNKYNNKDIFEKIINSYSIEHFIAEVIKNV
jgi:glycosyltransferase involved in cell wall biosynthesis